MDFNANQTNPLFSDEIQQVKNTLEFNQAEGLPQDPLTLDIPDSDLVKIVGERITTSQKFFEEKYNLSARRQKNETYLFGRQLDQLEADGKIKDYEGRSADNALYEIESSLKPLAMSKLPDIIVTPGGEDDQRKQSAKDLTKLIDDTNKKREQRMVLALGFKHLPAYFTAVIKARWNPDKGEKGDYEFLNIHPEYIVVDHTAVTTNPDDMSFIAQCTPKTVQDLLMQFPNKRTAILESLKLDQGNLDWKALATEVKPWEVWFDWYKRKDKNELLSKSDLTSIDEPGVNWERVSGVLWKLNDVILDKILDPNFDHIGEDKLFTNADPSNPKARQEVTPDQLMMSALTGDQIPNLKEEKIYHNYFKRPHKPFYFFGYDQWGKIVYDETSRIEQNVRNQENLDTQQKTIMDQLKTRWKHIWSKDSGMDKAAVQKLDMDNPKMDALIEGDPNKVHAGIAPERPDAAQFNAIGDTRSRMYAISGSSAVRGQIQSDTATTNQIAREADFTRTDDLVEDTINAASEWLAEWQMQFIKLRYTDEHFVEILGDAGTTTYLRIRRDTPMDGMEVKIKASSTDKLKAQRNAMDTAKLGAPYSNPLDYFNDMDMNDPDGRTERGMMFMADPMGYFTKYVLKLEGSQAQAAALTSGLPTGAPAVAPNSNSPVTPPPVSPPSIGQPAGGPTPTDTTQIAATPPATPTGSPRIA